LKEKRDLNILFKPQPVAEVSVAVAKIEPGPEASQEPGSAEGEGKEGEETVKTEPEAPEAEDAAVVEAATTDAEPEIAGADGIEATGDGEEMEVDQSEAVTEAAKVEETT
jgi:hypothetical protein